MRRVLGLLLSLLIAASAWGATTWYVDYVGGSDAANGTSDTTPWKHVHGDPQATGVAAAATIGATDTVLLKGGVVYALNNVAGVAIAASTNWANGATLKSGHLATPAWGTGRAIIDGNDETDAGYAIKVATRSNILIEGFEVRDIDVIGEDIAAVTVINSTSVTLRNLVVHNIGGAAFQKQCIEVDNTGTTADGNVVEYCEVYDSTEKGIELYQSGGNVVRYNTVYRHTDHGIQLSAQYNQVYGNIIHDVSAAVKGRAAQDPAGAIKTASSSTVTGGHNKIFSNLIYSSRVALIVETLGSNNVDGTEFIGNTAYNIGVGAGSVYGFIELNVTSTGRIQNSVFRNNIFSNVADQAGHRTALRVEQSALGNNNVFSNNLWYDPNAAIVVLTKVAGVNQYPTLANFADGGSQSPDWRLARAELGTGNSFDNDPSQIFNESALMTNPAAQDFTLGATSPCRDAGYTAGAPYNVDFAGTSRPQGAAYDIGAYETPVAAGGERTLILFPGFLAALEVMVTIVASMLTAWAVSAISRQIYRRRRR